MGAPPSIWLQVVFWERKEASVSVELFDFINHGANHYHRITPNPLAFGAPFRSARYDTNAIDIVHYLVHFRLRLQA